MTEAAVTTTPWARHQQIVDDVWQRMYPLTRHLNQALRRREGPSLKGKRPLLLPTKGSLVEHANDAFKLDVDYLTLEHKYAYIHAALMAINLALKSYPVDPDKRPRAELRERALANNMSFLQWTESILLRDLSSLFEEEMSIGEIEAIGGTINVPPHEFDEPADWRPWEEAQELRGPAVTILRRQLKYFEGRTSPVIYANVYAEGDVVMAFMSRCRAYTKDETECFANVVLAEEAIGIIDWLGDRVELDTTEELTFWDGVITESMKGVGQ